MSRRVALALGSGGARGFAHIGAIEVLEERGFEVCAVAGSSMGALVGGVMATGRLKDFRDWAVSLKQRDVLRLLDPKWAAAGAIGADRLVHQLNEFLTDVEIENLPIPYTAVATDIEARREVWFQKGLLRTAIRASIAIPGVITPVVVDGRLLADGGLLNPVPIEPTAASGADLTIAVSLQAPRTAQEPASPVRATATPQWVEGIRQRFQSRKPAHALPDDLRIGTVLGLSLDAMQDLIARYRLAGLPPDIHIAVPVSASSVMDFSRAAELVALGRELTTKALDDAGY
ncbi:patatin-like phospholipase family protein [Actinoplanes sp. Pm04-4]|jgi:NTE family protein|uniref:Patatin-like phospholipase family protein n=1 Tax=Paractinoplanes pyxinae TaxID=2997416 RepID=A0ABT4AVF4_9ACTN|nr:patatin-like phospholipase family protein [Actinoplanes pyxinae]MCY1138213.1 patatin-like phospholipase family protein [Actinoplanes pyxinae]